jgi:hypothetical protein
MKMVKMLIQVPVPLKAKIDSLRGQGYTASGYIRTLLERELKGKGVVGHGRQAT